MFRQASIRNRLILLLVSIVVGVFFFGSLMFLIHERKNMRLLYATLYETLSAFSRSVEREIVSAERLAVDIMSDGFVQERMRVLNDLPQNYAWYQVAQELISRLLSYSRLPDIPAIVCIDLEGRVINSRNDFPEFYTVLDVSEVESFRGSRDPFRWIITDAADNQFFYLRKIREIEQLSFRYLGTLVLVLDKSQLIKQTASHPFQAYMELAIRSDHTVVFASGAKINLVLENRPIDKRLFETRTVEGRTYFLAQVSSQNKRLQYVYMLPYELLFSDLSRFNTMLILFTIVLFMAILGVSVWMAGTISEPIIRLANTMRIVEAGGFSETKLEVQAYNRRDEIGTLYREFAIMLDRIETLIHESYRTELLLKDTQFRSLQAQINPHFLYNTLESINWLAQLNDEEEIAQMVQALGSILRASIDTKRVVIMLQEELDLLNQYVLIQRSRYGDRLAVDIDASDSCCKYAIPKLTLQPLVENSIKYGLERSAKSCRVSINARTAGKLVRIDVVDDGPGMPSDFVKKLLEGHVEPQGSGIGIKNIHERLKRLYGAAGSLSIDSDVGKGTTVTITLPQMTEEELAPRIGVVYEAQERIAGR
jgi:two-component system sensor histidine kinase YesM